MITILENEVKVFSVFNKDMRQSLIRNLARNLDHLVSNNFSQLSPRFFTLPDHQQLSDDQHLRLDPDKITRPKRLAAFEEMIQSNIKTRILSYMTRQEIQPSYTKYLALNTALQTGDEPMDQVVRWVLKNPGLHRKYFEQALYQGLDKLPHEIPELSHFFQQVEQKPSWYKPEKIEEALKFTYRLGLNNGLILRDYALMNGYRYPGFNRPLILTGALKKQAGRRLAETVQWWIDITEQEGLQRFSKGFTSTLYVRFIHALIRHQLQHSEKWDAETWGLPINQYDQAMTNIGFSGVVLIGIRALGIFPNQKEVDSFLHFWKYVGWLMGVEEQWLIDKEADGWKMIYWMQFAHPEADASSISLGTSLSQEPLQRQYRYLQAFQQKFAYKKHLEISQFLIGRKKMQSLGLSPQPVSWFPYCLIGCNLALYTAAKHVPKLQDLLEKKGRHLQKSGLLLYRQQPQSQTSMHQ